MSFSIIISLLSIIASLLGIFDPVVYSQETLNWATQARGQDIGNLIAAPLLLVSAFYVGKNSRFKSLHQGALIYFIYAYLVYSFSAHFNYLFLVYVSILGFSVYTLIGSVILPFDKKIPSIVSSKYKFSAMVLIGIGVLFSVLWLSEIVPAVITNTIPASLAPTGLWVNPIHVIDLSVILPAFILIGMLTLKKSLYGFRFLSPLLTFSVLMGTSIVATMLLMLIAGDQSAIAPLIMTGLIVIFSFIANLLVL